MKIKKDLADFKVIPNQLLDGNMEKTDADTDKSGNDMIDNAITLEISKRGFDLAKELEPFEDTYDITRGLLHGTGKEIISGKFIDILQENYQSKLKDVTENYSGKELEKQLRLLDKAYDEAVYSVSESYMKQLRILTGDTVLKFQRGRSYSSAAEAEAAYQKSLEEEAKKKYVIDSDMADSLQQNLREMLLALKENNADNELTFSDFYFTKNDIKNIGNLFLNKKTREDISKLHLSKFATSMIEKYNQIYAPK